MTWLWGLGLALVAGACAAWAWMRPARPSPGSAMAPDAVVRNIYRDRVAELDAEVAAGRLDADVRGQVEDELGLALLDDYREFESAPAAAGRLATAPAWRGALALIALVIGAAGGLYALVGMPTAASIKGASAVLKLDPANDRAALLDWRKRLDVHLAWHEDDAPSWYLLGNIDLALGDYGPATEAFARAATITGPDPVIDVYWLQARYLAQGGTFDKPTREIGDRILARNPSHPLVLELYAIDAYRAGNFREAVSFLNRALSNNLAADRAQSLLAGLETARGKMEPVLPRVDVAVSAKGAPPDGSALFVIARPPGGGMPFAVVRRPASQLPLDIVLDDTVSMNPAVPLSAAPAFEVVVRVSLSGTPAPHPGDWEWRSETFVPQTLTEPAQLSVQLTPPVDADLR